MSAAPKPCACNGASAVPKMAVSTGDEKAQGETKSLDPFVAEVLAEESRRLADDLVDLDLLPLPSLDDLGLTSLDDLDLPSWGEGNGTTARG